MHSTVALAALVAFSGSALASYGRYPCNLINTDGTISADQSQCDAGALITPGGGLKGSLPDPVNSICVQDQINLDYACGISGAACISDANCDVGTCNNGVCTGAPGTTCNGNDDACLGFVYCTDLLGAPIPSDTCGGIGAFCSDPGLVSAYMGDPATVVALGSETCAGSADGTNYCSYQGGVCAAHVTTIGGDCSFDPMFACSQTAAGQDLICQNGQTCQLATVPSGRARARRNEALFKRNVCPASHTACSIDGQKGFECIDTQSNIEQCGACASEGGVDCTQLAGVDAVGCVAGSCEIWSCQDNYTYDAISGACVAL
ncbi:hypothetical protein JCM8202_006298 [Rhodotorula sphaerocarpa]